MVKAKEGGHIVKKEMTMKPEKLTEQWPGELTMFSWMEFVAAIPSPMLVVTGWKSNGNENACLQSWSTFVSDTGELVCILGWVSKNGHMYQSLKETGCCVLNFPSRDVYDRCYQSIENNDFDVNEITDSGLTAEKAVCVNTPRIAECFLNIECELLWEQQNFKDSSNVVMALKAVHVCMDSDHYDHSKLGRYGDNGYIYNIHAPRNPDTGEVLAEKFGVLKYIK